MRFGRTVIVLAATLLAVGCGDKITNVTEPACCPTAVCPTPTPTPKPTPTPTPPPCEVRWEKQPPEVTYSPWSACKKIELVVANCTAKCNQSRTKTTIVNEKNSCNGRIREKSKKVETETRECECS